MRLRGRQHEDGVRGRLFQGLQQRVKGLRGEHVGLIDDVDLDAQRRRQILDPVAQLADLVDPPIGGGVDFDQVDRRARGDLHAGSAFAARLGALPVQAVDGFGQDPGSGRLPRPPHAGEQVGVRDPALLHRVLERTGNGILAHQVGEALRAVFQVQGLIGHQGSRQFYRALVVVDHHQRCRD